MSSLSNILISCVYAVLRGILIVTSYPIGVAMLGYYFLKYDIFKSRSRTRRQ